MTTYRHLDVGNPVSVDERRGGWSSVPTGRRDMADGAPCREPEALGRLIALHAGRGAWAMAFRALEAARATAQDDAQAEGDPAVGALGLPQAAVEALEAAGLWRLSDCARLTDDELCEKPRIGRNIVARVRAAAAARAERRAA